ncbi:hypothetical protein ACDX78_19880 [Virgibacillus oceani]
MYAIEGTVCDHHLHSAEVEGMEVELDENGQYSREITLETDDQTIEILVKVYTGIKKIDTLSHYVKWAPCEGHFEKTITFFTSSSYACFMGGAVTFKAHAQN